MLCHRVTAAPGAAAPPGLAFFGPAAIVASLEKDRVLRNACLKLNCAVAAKPDSLPTQPRKRKDMSLSGQLERKVSSVSMSDVDASAAEPDASESAAPSPAKKPRQSLNAAAHMLVDDEDNSWQAFDAQSVHFLALANILVMNAVHEAGTLLQDRFEYLVFDHQQWRCSCSKFGVQGKCFHTRSAAKVAADARPISAEPKATIQLRPDLWLVNDAGYAKAIVRRQKSAQVFEKPFLPPQGFVRSYFIVRLIGAPK